jgi:hypothetical protein
MELLMEEVSRGVLMLVKDAVLDARGIGAGRRESR